MQPVALPCGSFTPEAPKVERRGKSDSYRVRLTKWATPLENSVPFHGAGSRKGGKDVLSKS